MDPDAIARTIDPEQPARAAITAARRAVVRCRSLLTNRESFIVESTLAGHGALSLMKEAKRVGYRALLIYVALGDPELHIEGVRLRVAQGATTYPTLMYGDGTAGVCSTLLKRCAWLMKQQFWIMPAQSRNACSSWPATRSSGVQDLYHSGSKNSSFRWSSWTAPRCQRRSRIGLLKPRVIARF